VPFVIEDRAMDDVVASFRILLTLLMYPRPVVTSKLFMNGPPLEPEPKGHPT